MRALKLFIFLTLLIAPGCACCQVSTLPSVYVDSLILETKLNRQCQAYATALMAEVIVKDSVIFEKDKAIELQWKEINNFRQLDWELGAQAVSRQNDFKIVKKKHKRAVTRLGAVIAIEAVIIILLL